MRNTVFILQQHRDPEILYRCTLTFIRPSSRKTEILVLSCWFGTVFSNRSRVILCVPRPPVRPVPDCTDSDRCCPARLWPDNRFAGEAFCSLLCLLYCSFHCRQQGCSGRTVRTVSDDYWYPVRLLHPVRVTRPERPA